MKYDFDRITDRRGTDSLKYDFAKERGKPDGLLSMWVADMDFPAPPEVLADISKVTEHGIFGYTEAKNDYYEAVLNWFKERFNYTASRREIVKTPGVVFALAMAVRAFTNPDDSIMFQTPVYYPFYEVVLDNKRKLVKNPLVYKDGKYSIDFGDFERKLAENNVKMFILCSPHNPVGRVWRHEELASVHEICGRYGVIVVSDEIHCDFTFGNHTHTVFGHFDENAVICTAPSKTFNLAGLQAANIFIKNSELRRKFKDEITRSGYSQLNTIGLAACKSAYLNGGEWLAELKGYLAGNIETVREFLAEKLPSIALVPTEGTYLIWLDCKKLELTQEELDRLVTHKAKLWLDGGTMFGDEGRGFLRVNIACPRETVRTMLSRLEETF